MKNKIVGIVILMLVATTVVSATNINVKKDIKTINEVFPVIINTLNYGEEIETNQEEPDILYNPFNT